MALDVATGTITVTTGAVNTTFAVSGLSFQPEAVVLFWSGRATTGQAEADIRLGMGCFTSTSSRRAFGCQMDHANAAAGVTDQIWRNDCCVATLTTAGAVEGLADVSAVASDGFTLIVDDQFATALVVGWIAIGGTDLTDVEIVDFTLDTSTGTQNVGTSFALNTGADDKAVLFFGGLDDAVNTAGTWARQMFGVAAGNTPANAVAMTMSVDGVDPTQNISYCLAGECIAFGDADNSVGARAQVSAWLSNGFTINRLENNQASGVVRVSALVLKGGRFQVGDFTSSTGTTPASEGTTYVPKGLILGSCNRAQDTANTTTAGTEFAIGVAQSSSSRRCMSVLSKDAAATSDAGHSFNDDAMYANQSTAATIAIEGLMDLISFDSTPGFTWVMDDADPVASFIFYLVMGDGPTIVTRNPIDNLGHARVYTRIADNFRDIDDNFGFDEVTFQHDLAFEKQIPEQMLGHANVYARTATGIRDFDDNLGQANVYSRLAHGIRAFSNSLGFTDVYSRLAHGIRAYANSAGLSDAVLRTTIPLRSFSNSLGETDVYNYLAIRPKSYADLFGWTDATARLAHGNRAYTDTQGFAEAFARTVETIGGGILTISVFDNLGFAEAYARLAHGIRDIDESFGQTDTPARLANAIRSFSNTVGATDTFARLAHGIRAYSNSIGSPDAYARLAHAVRAYVQSLGIDDHAGIQAGALLIMVVDALGLANVFSRIAHGIRDIDQPLGGQSNSVPDRIAHGNRVIVNSPSFGFQNPPITTIGYRERELPLQRLGAAETFSKLSTIIRMTAETMGLQNLPINTIRLIEKELQFEFFGFDEPIFERRVGIDKDVGPDFLGFDENFARDVTQPAFLSIAVFDFLAMSDPNFGKIGVRGRQIAEEKVGTFDTVSFNFQIIFTRFLEEALGTQSLFNKLTIARRGFTDRLGEADVYSRLVIALRSFSNTIGATDATNRTATLLRNLSNSLGSVETFSRIAHGLRAITDTLGLDDAFFITGVGPAIRTIAVFDLLGGATVFARLAHANRNVPQLLGATETYSRLAHALRNIIESAGFTEVFSRFSPNALTITDSLGGTQAFTRLASALRPYTDQLGVFGSGVPFTSPRIQVLWRRAMIDLLGLDDTERFSTRWLRSFVNTLGAVDVFARIGHANRNLIDNFGFAEVYTRLFSTHRTYTDTTGLTDTFARIAHGNRQLADLTGLHDEFTRQVNYLRLFTDLMGLDDQINIVEAGVGIFLIAVFDSLGLTDAPLRQSDAIRTQTDTIGVSDAALRQAQALRAYSDNLAQIDTASRTSDAIRSFTETVPVVDTAARQLQVLRLATDIVGLTDVLTHTTAYSRMLADLTGLDDVFDRRANIRRQVIDSLRFLDVYDRTASIFRVITDLLGLDEVLLILTAAFLEGVPTGRAVKLRVFVPGAQELSIYSPGAYDAVVYVPGAQKLEVIN